MYQDKKFYSNNMEIQKLLNNTVYDKTNAPFYSTLPQYNNSQQNYIDRLNYTYTKNQMDLNKNACNLEQNLGYQEYLTEMRAKADADKQLTFSDIYKNKEGRLIYVLNKPNCCRLSGGELLNVRDYKSFIYFSNYPKMQRLLIISWDYDEHIIGFDYGVDGVKVNDFLRKLNSHGLHLLVSGRAQKEAASTLLSYSVENAEKIELPFDFGWWKDIYEEWHFAKDDAMTLKGEKNKIEW